MLQALSTMSDSGLSNEQEIRSDCTCEDVAEPFLYQVNERVLCYHGPVLYEAKVLKVEERTVEKCGNLAERVPFYFVHYKGWKAKYDLVS